MKQILTPDQIADLAGIQGICDEIHTELVLIGAMALVILFGDLRRFTRDLDLTVALDLNDFGRLTSRLASIGWTPSPRHEHRWIAPHQTIVDLLPAGPMLRRQGAITWPASQFTMSLAGFDQVFIHAVAVQMSGGLIVRVAPPVITALLKIIAYVEDPYRREKDLQDLRVILARYEENGDRLFSDEVFDAGLPDYEFTNAFLLGLDLRTLATHKDAGYIDRFLSGLAEQEDDGRFDEELDYSFRSFRGQIAAFRRGFTGSE